LILGLKFGVNDKIRFYMQIKITLLSLLTAARKLIATDATYVTPVQKTDRVIAAFRDAETKLVLCSFDDNRATLFTLEGAVKKAASNLKALNLVEEAVAAVQSAAVERYGERTYHESTELIRDNPVHESALKIMDHAIKAATPAVGSPADVEIRIPTQVEPPEDGKSKLTFKPPA
jgi:hypothetical protein